MESGKADRGIINMTIKKLTASFFSSGYYGTTHEHQIWLMTLLDKIEELENKIKKLEDKL